MVSLLALVVVCVLAIVSGRGRIDPTNADQNIGRVTVQGMAAGQGVYPAMNHALRVTNGPPKSGRDFRQPLIYEMWHALGSEGAIWIAYVILIGVAGAAVATTSEAPLVAPLIAVYLLGAAHLDQYFQVEMWAVPLTLLATAAWRKAWYKTAMVLGATASLVRELALLVIVGGFWEGRKRRWPWVLGGAVAAALIVAHFAYAARYATPTGFEAPLLGRVDPGWVLLVAGVGLTHGFVVASVLLALVAVRFVQDRDLARFIGPMVALPLVGVVIHREYWGFMVVPFEILFAAEAATIMVTAIRNRGNEPAGVSLIGPG